jgi:hypothetical protein
MIWLIETVAIARGGRVPSPPREAWSSLIVEDGHEARVFILSPTTNQLALPIVAA